MTDDYQNETYLGLLEKLILSVALRVNYEARVAFVSGLPMLHLNVEILMSQSPIIRSLDRGLLFLIVFCSVESR